MDRSLTSVFVDDCIAAGVLGRVVGGEGMEAAPRRLARLLNLLLRIISWGRATRPVRSGPRT